MFKREDFSAVEELRKTLGGINGVKNVQEQLGLEYIVTVSSQEEKTNVEKVAELLKNQATKFNISLEVIPVTEFELKEIQEKLMKQLSKSSQFKS